jgi:hypothetical protein
LARSVANADLIAFLQALPESRRAEASATGRPYVVGTGQLGNRKNQWHWPRDTQLGEDAHHYAQRNGVQVLALLRTLALNLLRCNSFRSIRAGLMAVAHVISRMLGWVGLSHRDGRK